MLFRKKMDRLCAYCQHAGRMDDDHVICQYKGVVCAEGQCRRFRYDPLKRIPPRMKAKSFEALEKEDFSL